MFMTILEAKVEPEKWEDLKSKFREMAQRIPPQMLHTYLAQSVSDPTVWKGVSLWRSREALMEYRKEVQTPEGIALFKSMGAEPAVSMYDVAEFA